MSKPHYFTLTPDERTMLADALEMYSFQVAEALAIMHTRHPEASAGVRFRAALDLVPKLASKLRLAG